MTETPRKFMLQLTIRESEPGDPVQVALMLGEDEKEQAVLAVVAGGFAADDTGAGMLSDMLRDTADAIDEHLGRERQRTETADIPAVRPRFNPQPRKP